MVAVATDDDTRFLKVETQAMLNSNAERIYRWDASTTVQEKKTGQSGTFRNIRDLIMWFSKPRKEGVADGAEINDSFPAPAGSVLFVFDAMYYLQETAGGKHSNPTLTREMKNCMSMLVEQKKTVFLIGHGEPYVPPEMKSMIPVFDYPLPDLDYMHGLVVKMTKCFATEDQRKTDPGSGLKISFEEIDNIARLLLGLREMEAESILKRSILENMKKRNVDNSIPQGFDIEIILQSKMDACETNAGISITMPSHNKSGLHGRRLIGGSHAIADWFMGVKEQFSPEARNDGIDLPKGAVIFGMGGTGKDLFVEQMAQEIGWPCVHADLGASKGSFQGDSHRNFRQILQFAEANSPCFLVLSEFEKMMAGAMTPGAAACDGGTNQEILATWLNWTQKRTAPVYVWGLTNDITGLSQASLRAGRWDRVWFMDLPPDQDRMEIFAVHLERAMWNPAEFDLAELAALTPGYTGAEIRAIINEAIVQKFLKEGPKSKGYMLTQDHIKSAINVIPSTMKLRQQEVLAIREFAKTGGYSIANSTTIIGAGNQEKSSVIDQIGKIIQDNTTPTPPSS